MNNDVDWRKPKVALENLLSGEPSLPPDEGVYIPQYRYWRNSLMNNKTDYYRPTMDFRYVRRRPSAWAAHELVLQQRWHSPVTGEEDQWRELPVVEDGE